MTPKQKHNLLLEKLDEVNKTANIRQYLQYGSTKIRGSKMNFIFAFVDDGNGNAFPLGFVSYENNEIGIVYVTDEIRRNGIAKELLKLADKVSGKKLTDDGQITSDGKKLFKSTGRKITKSAKAPDKKSMNFNISRVILSMMGTSVKQFKVLKKVKMFKGD